MGARAADRAAAGDVAQLEERLLCTQEVGSSSLLVSTRENSVGRWPRESVLEQLLEQMQG